MNTTEKDDFVAEVNRALAAFDKPAASAQKILIWWETLRELNLSQIRDALRQHIKTGRWAPRPADVFRRVTGREEGGMVSGPTLCSVPGCGRRWSVKLDASPPKCSLHHWGPEKRGDESPHPFPWQDLLGACRAIDKIGEERAVRGYGREIVDYVLANTAEIFAMMPDHGRAGNAGKFLTTNAARE